MAPDADQDITVALKQGEHYVESLLGRKRFINNKVVAAEPESQIAIEDFLLRGEQYDE